jgi:predicted nuclease of predicted toxin-antitoxin system
MKFHLDKNVNPAIASGLRIRGIDVTTTPEAGLRQAPDESQLEYAKAAGRVLFTHDDDFLRVQTDVCRLTMLASFTAVRADEPSDRFSNGSS